MSFHMFLETFDFLSFTIDVSSIFGFMDHESIMANLPPCEVPPWQTKALIGGGTTIVVPSMRPKIKASFLMGGTLHGGRLTSHESMLQGQKTEGKPLSQHNNTNSTRLSCEFSENRPWVLSWMLPPFRSLAFPYGINSSTPIVGVCIPIIRIPTKGGMSDESVFESFWAPKSFFVATLEDLRINLFFLGCTQRDTHTQRPIYQRLLWEGAVSRNSSSVLASQPK